MEESLFVLIVWTGRHLLHAEAIWMWALYARTRMTPCHSVRRKLLSQHIVLGHSEFLHEKRSMHET